VCVIVPTDVDSQGWKGCEYGICVFSAFPPFGAEIQDTISKPQESSFELFENWKSLRRLKLVGLKFVRSGKFFMRVNVYDETFVYHRYLEIA
jgi:hypothetical protein